MGEQVAGDKAQVKLQKAKGNHCNNGEEYIYNVSCFDCREYDEEGEE